MNNHDGKVLIPAPAENWLPRQPATFELVTRLVLCSREPYKSRVLCLVQGQPLRLCREPDNPHDWQAIRVETCDGQPVGYLDADTAGYLAILLDRAPGLDDQSFVECLALRAPENDPAARRLRYPRLFLHLRIQMASAWPLFTIAAVLGLKTENFAERFNLAGNPWLSPLQTLHERYLRCGHDNFCLPASLVKAWQYLTT